MLVRLVDRLRRPANRARGAAGQRQADRLQRGTQPNAATSMRGGQASDLVSEPAHRAAAILTDEQTHPQHDLHPSTTHRRVGKPTLVATVHPRTQVTTPRARRRFPI
jgi:hypothetical protein